VPKVLDFGISKVLVDETTGKHMSSGMTRTGALLGSPLYMSPEQAAGDKSIDARSDVHSLGVLLWECLTGQPPFTADTYGLLLVEIIQGERRSLDSVLPSVPPGVSRLVARAIARNRADRFANAGEFAAALEEQLSALGHEPELTGRKSADEFLRKLGGPETERKERATSTTAAVSVPAPSEPIAAAESAQLTREAPVRGAHTDEPVSIPKTKRAPLYVVAAGLVAFAIAIAALAFRPRETEPPAGETPPPATSEPSPAATTPSVTPEVTATPSAQPPAAPSASEAPRPKLVVQPRTTGKKPPPAAPAEKPTGPAPVHHGVTNSGL
jgi:serine/threonine-protein kinase